MSDLHYLTAVGALRLFRARQLSPVELMEAVIASAEAVEPKINAFGNRYYDEALQAAREAEARYAGRGRRPRALEGIPIAIKEETPIRGRSWLGLAVDNQGRDDPLRSDLWAIYRRASR